MQKTKLIATAEIAQELGVSQSFAYKLVRELNTELKAKGYITVAGKISRAYFEEKFYGLKEGA